MKRELLIGCGTNRDKRLAVPGDESWGELVTLDYCEQYNPDVVHNLTKKLPFDADSFNSISAYEVLEHLGEQGDYITLFQQFSDYWRVLRPGGYFYATVPCWKSLWAFGEPGHKRVINEGTLTFLCRPRYSDGTMMTPSFDYRAHLDCDFDILSLGHSAKDNNHDLCIFWFALSAIKPPR